MNILKTFLNKFRGVETRAIISGDNFYFDDETINNFGSNTEKALTVNAVWCAIRTISQDIASLPIITYEKVNEDSRKRATEIPVYDILHKSPGNNITAFNFKELITSTLLLYGNCYVQIVKNGLEEVDTLNYLHPDYVVVKKKDWKYYYAIKASDNQVYVLNQEDVLHFSILSTDGVVGRTPIQANSETLGLCKSTQEIQAKAFKNASKPNGILICPPQINKSPEELSQFRDAFEKVHKGNENAGRIALLNYGIEYKETSKISAVDLQLIELRKFSIDDISRIFLIPPIKLSNNYYGQSSYNNSEIQNRQYYDQTIRPMLVRIENELNNKLFMDSNYYCEFLVDSLLRADSTTRYANYSTGINTGFLSVNEVRKFENLDPVSGGDKHMLPLHLSDIKNNSSDDEDLDTEDDNSNGKEKTNKEGNKEEQTGKVSISRNQEKEEEEITTVDKTAIENRNIQKRLIYRNQFLNLFQDSFISIIKRNKSESLNMYRSYIKNNEYNTGDFIGFLNDKFDNNYIQVRMRPILYTYLTGLNSMISSEVGSGTIRNLDEFLNKHIESFSKKYSISTVKRIENILTDVSTDDSVENIIIKNFDDLASDKSSKMAYLEIRKLEGLFVEQFFKDNNIIMKKWVSVDSCPICSSLNGKVVQVGQPFLKRGMAVGGNENQKPMEVKSNLKFPPVHYGCECFISQV